MDGIHDLGGKQGFGPIDRSGEEEGFHHEWEGREWGMSRCARTPDITIDWWRHCRELILAEDYLNRPYYDSWSQTDFSTYIEAGMISIEEIKNGKADPALDPGFTAPSTMNREDILDADRKKAMRFDGPTSDPVKFQIGESVQTQKDSHSGHTRLPQYARGRTGTIVRHHGAHCFPDSSAQGIEVFQHLYTVEFALSELWPESKGSKDKINLDLWESYLLPADE